MSGDGARTQPPEPAHFRSLNLYARLGISEEATEAQIRSAYRSLLKRMHPDLHGHHGEDHRARFDEVMRAANEARDTLLDPEKRARYDLRRRGPCYSATGPKSKGERKGERKHHRHYAGRDDRHHSQAHSGDGEQGWVEGLWQEMPDFVQRALTSLKDWWSRTP